MTTRRPVRAISKQDELTKTVVTLLLEAAKVLYEKGDLYPTEDSALVVVPYLREREDGVLITVNSPALMERWPR